MAIKRALCTLALLAIALGACKGKHSRLVVENEGENTGPSLASVLKMNDAQAGAQLVNGFYALEGNSWRWTAGKFTALLHVPLAASQRGGTLSFNFNVPDVVIQKLKTIRLSVSVNGQLLKSTDYTAPGLYTFTADVPASLLGTDSLKADFTLDKTLPSSTSDARTLGVIATSISLATK